MGYRAPTVIYTIAAIHVIYIIAFIHVIYTIAAIHVIYTIAAIHVIYTIGFIYATSFATNVSSLSSTLCSAWDLHNPRYYRVNHALLLL